MPTTDLSDSRRPRSPPQGNRPGRAARDGVVTRREPTWQERPRRRRTLLHVATDSATVQSTHPLYGHVVVELCGEYEWLAAVVVARVVRRTAITLALVLPEPPTAEQIRAEAGERLLRATAALQNAINTMPPVASPNGRPQT